MQNKRSMPWRETKDPYRIWLSEIILQQTRVAQGLPYYVKFTETYPDVNALAASPEEKVMKLWQGLGYYSRARNLHFTAKYVVNELGGVFPKTYKELLQLKGVGDYTASAIASICYDEPTAVVDGNVYRVLSRVFGIATPINTTSGIKQFKALAQELIDTSQPGTFNQALMEFGARHCVPQNPDCTRCIFATTCAALEEGQVAVWPVKLKNLKIKKLYFNYIVPLSTDGKTVLQQRTKKGIWQKLYEFPLVETEQLVEAEALNKNESFVGLKNRFKFESVILYNETPIVHKLSHRTIETRFWIAECEKLDEKGIAISEITDFPVPVLIDSFISSFSGFQD